MGARGRVRYSRWIPGRQYWLVSDPCGIVCVVFTWLLLSYAQFCALTIFLAYIEEHPWHTVINATFFEMFFILAVGSHMKTMLTDPGAIPRGMLSNHHMLSMLELEQQSLQCSTGAEVLYKCTKCSSIKPERAHHCSVCQRCIKRMDHHCPWVNNCVGERNQKPFVLFTLYIATISFHTLYWAVRHFVWCVNAEWSKCSHFGPPATTILLIFLLFEAILFSIFNSVMFGTQISAICSDLTGIESLKAEHHRWRDPSDDEDTDLELGGIGKKPKADRWKNIQAVLGGHLNFSYSC